MVHLDRPEGKKKVAPWGRLRSKQRRSCSCTGRPRSPENLAVVILPPRCDSRFVKHMICCRNCCVFYQKPKTWLDGTEVLLASFCSRFWLVVRFRLAVFITWFWSHWLGACLSGNIIYGVRCPPTYVVVSGGGTRVKLGAARLSEWI